MCCSSRCSTPRRSLRSLARRSCRLAHKGSLTTVRWQLGSASIRAGIRGDRGAFDHLLLARKTGARVHFAGLSSVRTRDGPQGEAGGSAVRAIAIHTAPRRDGIGYFVRIAGEPSVSHRALIARRCAAARDARSSGRLRSHPGRRGREALPFSEAEACTRPSTAPALTLKWAAEASAAFDGDRGIRATRPRSRIDAGTSPWHRRGRLLPRRKLLESEPSPLRSHVKNRPIGLRRRGRVCYTLVRRLSYSSAPRNA